MSANQASLLFAAGLREYHRFADVGCGSLRVGRLLIPYLRAGNYHGIEPDRAMLEEGITQELGREILTLKRPRFLHERDFPLPGFGVAFDYVLAQSIWSHTYPGLMRFGFQKVASSLAENGRMFATFQEGLERDREGSGWLYPGVVPYRWRQVERILGEAGLVGRVLNWPHPRQVWFVAARPDLEGEIGEFADKLKPPIT